MYILTDILFGVSHDYLRIKKIVVIDNLSMIFIPCPLHRIQSNIRSTNILNKLNNRVSLAESLYLDV